MAAPSLSVIDNFNRANGALSGPDYVAAYSAGSGAIPTISSNQLASGTGSDTDSGCYYAPVGICADCEVFLTVRALPSPTSMSVMKLRAHTMNVARSGPPANSNDWSGIQMRVLGTGEMTTENFNGTETSTIEDPGAEPIALGDTFGLVVVSGVVQMWYRPSGGAWEQLGLGVSDSTYPSGYIGFAFDEGTARLDDFGGGSLDPEQVVTTTFSVNF